MENLTTRFNEKIEEVDKRLQSLQAPKPLPTPLCKKEEVDYKPKKPKTVIVVDDEDEGINKKKKKKLSSQEAWKMFHLRQRARRRAEEQEDIDALEASL